MYFAKNVANIIFPFNSWLSFHRLCRLTRLLCRYNSGRPHCRPGHSLSPLHLIANGLFVSFSPVDSQVLFSSVDTFPYLGSLITEDGECTTEFLTRLNRGQAIGASLQKIWKSHSIPISTKIRLMKTLVWPVATYGCES